MRKPDFFIVGAPKCGTTALQMYLAAHPDIFMPRRTEAHYFGTDIAAPFFVRDETEYLALFADAGTHRRVGDKAIWCLYSTRAAREIYAFNPTSAIIILLRNPVDMMHSLHNQRVYSGREDIRDFEAALSAEDDRRRGIRLPAYPYPIEGLFYRQLGKYTEQVRRYFEVFGREGVHVVVYDDLKANPATCYKEVCEFLRVDTKWKPEFRIINSSHRVRSRRVDKGLRFVAPRLRPLARTLVPRPARQLFMKTVRRMNTTYAPRALMNPVVRQGLQEWFAPEIDALSALLGRDLTHWCKLEATK
jgi:hypothetical protein